MPLLPIMAYMALRGFSARLFHSLYLFKLRSYTWVLALKQKVPACFSQAGTFCIGVYLLIYFSGQTTSRLSLMNTPKFTAISWSSSKYKSIISFS